MVPEIVLGFIVFLVCFYLDIEIVIAAVLPVLITLALRSKGIEFAWGYGLLAYGFLLTSALIRIYLITKKLTSELSSREILESILKKEK